MLVFDETGKHNHTEGETENMRLQVKVEKKYLPRN